MFSGSIHTHSDNSLFDSVAKVNQLAQRAKELGASAMALTDHGTLTGTWDFLDACKKVGIKGVVGVEFYVGGDSSREHLLVLPKDEQGFQAISKAVTESNYNLVGGHPIASTEVIRKWFGEGSIGHNRVIATSACIGGVLGSVFLSNENYERMQNKIRAKMQKESNPASPLYVQLCNNYERLEQEVEQLKEEKTRARVTASKKYAQRIKRATKANDEEELAKIQKEQEESAACEKALPALEKQFKAKQKELTELRNRKKDVEASHQKYRTFQDTIDELEKKKISEDEMYDLCMTKLDEYRNIFGENDFFIELQYHGIPEEKKIMPILAEIAEFTGTPVVASNDIHNVTREDAEGRAVTFSQKYNKWTGISESDWEMYMKTDEELSEWLLKIFSPSVVDEAMRNIRFILDQCNLNFEFKTHYPKFKCPEGAVQRLRNLVEQGKKRVAKWTPEYQARVEHELAVIEKQGFSDYLCVVEDYLTYGRLVGKVDLNDPRFLADPFNLELLKKLGEGRVGEGIGPGRGSAAGSLVCYLIGITDIDPIPLNLLFERFLNPQRVTMPDIDSDFAVDVRPWVIEYAKHIYGESAVCQIMTSNFFLAKNAIRAAGRACAAKYNAEHNSDKDFYDLTDQLSAMADGKLADIEELVCEEYRDNEIALEIFRFAKLLEGRMSSVGTHAAGIVISDNNDISDYLPLMCVEGKMSCQCNKERVETLGCLKMDALGLRNLSVITDCERAVLTTTGKRLAFNEIPYRKEVFQRIFQTGNTNGVFQFESDGMKKTLRDFGPDKFEDLILLVAVYRPGPLQYIPDITAVKKGEKKPDYVIPEMARILDATYGKPVYQEQLMAIFSDFAGFTLGEADIIRRLMSKKKTEEFLKYKDKFINGLIAHGAKRDKAETFWGELVNFSEYAFNKSHAAVYARIAYVTAYLKMYHPEAYAVGCLNYPATDGFDAALKDAMDSGIHFLTPDINKAYENFVLDGKDIIYGMSSIAGVKKGATKIVEERKSNGIYRSFIEFCKRTSTPKGITEKLIKAGAFDELYSSRLGLLEAQSLVQDTVKKILEKELLLAEEEDEKKREKIKQAIKNLEDKLEGWYENTSENMISRLKDEKDVLGCFISQHPMSGLNIPKKLEYTPIDSLKRNKSTVVAFVSNLVIRRRRSDNKPFASFDIEDCSGKMKAACFTEAYEAYSQYLSEDSIVVLKGQSRYSERDGCNIFTVFEVETFVEETKTVEIPVPSAEIWDQEQKRVLPYTEQFGDRLVVYFEDTGVFLETDYLVNRDIQKANFNW